jgi:hypothetical protein
MSKNEQGVPTFMDLIAQLSELEQLREQVKKAELAVRSRGVGRRKRKFIRRLSPPLNQSGNHRSFFPT